MLRILMSFVLSLVFFINPMLGQLFEGRQSTTHMEYMSAAALLYNDEEPSQLDQNFGTLLSEFIEFGESVRIDSLVSDEQPTEANQPIMNELPDINFQRESADGTKGIAPVIEADGVEAPVETKEDKSAPVIEKNVNTDVAEKPQSAVATAPQSIVVASQNAVVVAPQNKEIQESQNSVVAEPQSAVTAAPPVQDTIPQGSNASVEQPQATPQVKEPTETLLPYVIDVTEPKEIKTIDVSRSSSGLIGIRYLNVSGKTVKLLIDKGGIRYTYNIKGDQSLESFSLQSGDGEYKISLLENTEGNQYRYLITETVNVKIINKNDVFLSSVQMINWNEQMNAIKKAKELTANVQQEDEKIKRIYEYVVQNIQYDYSKLNRLPSTYLPSIDETFSTNLGICYDFASLMSAMLRSVGIPTRLVMGYAEGVNGYHAWNEIYLSASNSWIIVDTSFDSQMRAGKAQYTMIKNTKYEKLKEY